MRKKNSIEEKVLRIKLPVRIIAVAVLTSSMIIAVAGEVSAQQRNRPRYTEEEREAIHKEHTARIIDRLDLTKEQEEKLLPLLEEGIGLHRNGHFARNRRSKRGEGNACRMAGRHAEMAGHFRNCRFAARPDDSYHNGKVNRPKRKFVSDSCRGLSHGRDFHRKSFHRRSFHKNGPLMGRRQERRKAIEKILTREQIEKLHDIHMELRKEMLEEEASDDR